ncbi:class I SAM-dependent methyltransferase [Aliiglaciecola sp. CAU 1673]|uniref:class I SAM-dependent rRNA methyltransferase n=1 Tax=Aliiglaciecola sp. CAU 1673 TaxID=3032595 RepID=UPI0023D9FDCC|nr:class I SAM-dependent methyltransferase [Aliiglaciecola sp. CAU 1673]MDF2177577.1 class I SAM-dependent methyltransferase [Aliiglaciecola sp. CAU 1673]
MPSTLILHPERDKSLLRRHPWIFASAIKSQKGRARLGDTVDILNHEGKWLARGAWSPHSQIQARVWTFKEDEVIDNAFFLRRIQSAWEGRQELIARQGLTGCRVVAAESDGLPGVTIDKYADLLVCQLLSAGAEKHRDKILWALDKLFPECAIYERSDVAVRQKEGLELLVQMHKGKLPEEVIIEENGVKILVNPAQGHKTGFYLDQRDNRAVAARYAKDRRVLNCFSYTGTFGSYALAGGARHVTNLDVSDSALTLARRNLQINQLDESRSDFINADVFDALRKYHQDGQQFDQIILDPPKFVESKANLTRACRGYKDINLYAMQILSPGGILCTFSCSGLMPTELFHKVVADAALDAGRDVQFLERLSQAPDHPVASSYPEGYYLKGLVCRVL